MTVKVKICGLSTPHTMEAALAAGADFVGLVFFPKSPRNVSVEQAAQLAAQAQGRASTVALTVDADDGLLQQIAERVKPDFIQAHGSETTQRVAAIQALTGIPVIKAVKVRERQHVDAAAAYAPVSAFLLYDALAPQGAALPGGNGLAFDWTILDGANRPFMLAGGLTPANVREALQVTRAAMLDVSSGVESAPGIKDPQAIVKFIEAAKAAR